MSEIDDEDKLTLLREARSIDKILHLVPEIARIDNSLTCTVCNVNFTFDFSCGVSFTDQNMPRSFRNLKRSVLRHVELASHASNISKVKALNKRQAELLNKGKENGLTCAGLAYNCYYNFSSYTSYEHSVATVYSAGGNIGTKNHSKEFPRLFLPALYNTLREEFVSFMKVNKLPFGLLADKMTVSHRTRHIVGIRIPIWDINCPNIVKDVYVQSSSIKHHEGFDVASHLLNSLETAGFSRPYVARYISGLAMDGQYTKLSVNVHINDSLDSNANLSWDPMHSLQLAYDDSNKISGKTDDVKKTKYKFIDETIETITAISKLVKSGQVFEVLLDHKNLLNIFYVPKIFKTMKFVAYSETVFKTFINNYPAYVATMQDIENVGLRDKLMSADFIVNMLFLSDVICRIARCSKQVQLCGLLPWKYPWYIECLKTDLNLLIEIVKGLEQ